MTTKDQQTLPEPLRDFVAHARRFAEGLKLLSFDDDSDIGVVTAGDRLAAALDALGERLVRPAKPDTGTGLDDIAEIVAPAIETFSSLVSTFLQDAASGATSLPDMDDIAVAMGLLGQSETQLARLLELVPASAQNVPSPGRAELVECLRSAGVPLDRVGLHPPTMIKVIILIVIVVVFLKRGDAKTLVITIVNILVVIERRAQGGSKIPGGGAPGQPGTPPTPPGTTPPPTPPVSFDPCAAKGEFPLIVDGTGATDGQALVDAARKAIGRAAERCGSTCRPRFVRLTDEFARTGGENGEPVRLARRFIFRCVKP